MKMSDTTNSQQSETIYRVRSYIGNNCLLSRIKLDGLSTDQGFDVLNKITGKPEMITWGSLPTWVLKSMYEAIGVVLAQRAEAGVE